MVTRSFEVRSLVPPRYGHSFLRGQVTRSSEVRSLVPSRYGHSFLRGMVTRSFEVRSLVPSRSGHLFLRGRPLVPVTRSSEVKGSLPSWPRVVVPSLSKRPPPKMNNHPPFPQPPILSTLMPNLAQLLSWHSLLLRMLIHKQAPLLA